MKKNIDRDDDKLVLSKNTLKDFTTRTGVKAGLYVSLNCYTRGGSSAFRCGGCRCE